MEQFIVRVELHDAKWPDDYIKLHSEMQKKGFTNIVTSTSGVKYQLPPAEYYKIGDLDSNSVLKQAQSAASKVKPKHAVVVGACSRVEFEGLSQVI